MMLANTITQDSKMKVAKSIRSWSSWLITHPREIHRCSDELEQRIGPQNCRLGVRGYDWHAATDPAELSNWSFPTEGLSSDELTVIDRLREVARHIQNDSSLRDYDVAVGELVTLAIETAWRIRQSSTMKEGMARAYTLQEAAERVGVSDRHLREFIRDGRLQSFTIGTSRRISHNALQRFIDQRESENTSD